MLDLSDIIVATFEIDVFDCDGLAGSFVEGAVDGTEGAAWKNIIRRDPKANDGGI